MTLHIGEPLERQRRADAKRGPWCGRCGHEYRIRSGERKGEHEIAHMAFNRCPYCAAHGAITQIRPFREASYSALEAVDEIEGCETRYYFSRILKRYEPQNKYATWGNIGHEKAEAWLTYGKLPIVNHLEAGNLKGDSPKVIDLKMSIALLAGIPLMPPPSLPTLEVERDFHFEFEGVRYGGWKDYAAALDSVYAWGPYPDLRRFASRSLIGDHKFVGSFDYILPVDTFRRTVQPVLYAWDDVRRGSQIVCKNWVYMIRGERRAQPLRTEIPADLAFEEMQKLTPKAKRLLSLHAVRPEEINPRELRTNPKACPKYGQMCPHLDYCHVDRGALILVMLDRINVEAFIQKQIDENGEKIEMNNMSGLDAVLNNSGMATPGASGTFGGPAAQSSPQATLTPPPAGALYVQHQDPAYWTAYGNMYPAHFVEYQGNRHRVPKEHFLAAMQAGGAYVSPEVPANPTPAANPFGAPAAGAPQGAPVQGFGAAVNPQGYPGGGPEPHLPGHGAPAGAPQGFPVNGGAQGAPTNTVGVQAITPNGEPGREPGTRGRPKKNKTVELVFSNGSKATIPIDDLADAMVDAIVAKLSA